jgi:hypothetical protein
MCENDSLMLFFGRSGSSWGQNDRPVVHGGKM